ncbi:MAG TPA: YihY/virulence factor BrkB family protein [Woeseiaceae bacterium]|nr:YihY/virulence factor BrkB family protein [Woeseiaceae bacterium]
MIPKLQAKIDHLVWSRELESKGQAGRATAVALQYLYALLRDIFAGELTLRAMSLVYTTLLSVVPLVAFSFSVLKGLGVHNRLRPYLYEVLAPLGDQGIRITEEVINVVENVEGGVLGGLSLAFFVFTAISMVQKVEGAFNHVWHVSQPRSIARRFSEYTVVLLISPVVVVVALGMIASIRSTAVVQTILSHESIGPLLLSIGEIAPFLLITGVFIFLYLFVPNTRVSFKAAAIGGLLGGVLWATLGAIFANFVAYTTTKQLIYSSFAVAISALIWLYLSWLVLLIGAQLSFYLQHPEYLRIGRREPRLSNSMRECLALNIMYLVAKAFREPSRSVTFDRMSDQLKVPAIALTPVVNHLEDAGLLLTTEKESLIPGRDISRIRLSDILQVVRRRGNTGSYRGPRWLPGIDQLGKQVEEAVEGVVGNRTLAELVDELDSGSKQAT